jgi:hypothetical protein
MMAGKHPADNIDLVEKTWELLVSSRIHVFLYIYVHMYQGQSRNTIRVQDFWNARSQTLNHHFDPLSFWSAGQGWIFPAGTYYPVGGKSPATIFRFGDWVQLASRPPFVYGICAGVILFQQDAVDCIAAIVLPSMI